MKIIDIPVSRHPAENPGVRESCRGVVIRDGMLLLSCEVRTGQWFLPGGGVEPEETLVQCCARELAEETGFAEEPKCHFLTIREHCREWLYITHYFTCQITGETARRLTAGEREVGLEPRWFALEDALARFAGYQDHDREPMKMGAYRREYEALKVYQISVLDEKRQHST